MATTGADVYTAMGQLIPTGTTKGSSAGQLDVAHTLLLSSLGHSTTLNDINTADAVNESAGDLLGRLGASVDSAAV